MTRIILGFALAVGLIAMVACNEPNPSPANPSETTRAATDLPGPSTSKTTQELPKQTPPTGVPGDTSESTANIAADKKAADNKTADTGGADSEWAGAPVELFDGESLDGWEVINFGGEGDCHIKDGLIVLEPGDPLTGITSTLKDLPETNYEVSLEARKTQGIDFFCGLTFPVAESHCTFVVGGWAGSVVGLSCIDDQDASTNETNRLMKFVDDRWYKIRVRVRPEQIEAWIDDEKVVDQNIVGRKISLRTETMLCRPLGICNFQTQSELKNFQVRRLKPLVNAASENVDTPEANSDVDPATEHGDNATPTGAGKAGK